MSVLREPVKDTGVTVRLCYFKPASGLNEEQSRRYAANRLGVVRQLHHSESKPMDSVDLALVVNGIPVATAELKNPLSGQGIEQAMTQYRTDRNPHDLIFRARALVHFAVDPHRVAMTTKLAGQDTRFLPFDQGSAGPGHPGTAGNPGVADGYQTAYLWRQVWQRDAWLDLLGSFVHAEDGRILFPRYHQWHAVRSIIEATAADGAGVDRLVQHSAGSGKSQHHRVDRARPLPTARDATMCRSSTRSSSSPTGRCWTGSCSRPWPGWTTRRARSCGSTRSPSSSRTPWRATRRGSSSPRSRSSPSSPSSPPRPQLRVRPPGSWGAGSRSSSTRRTPRRPGTR